MDFVEEVYKLTDMMPRSDLYVSLGSIAELETQLLLAERLKFIPQAPLESLSEIKKLLLGLIRAKKGN